MLLNRPSDRHYILEVGNDDNGIIAVVGRDERHACLPNPVLGPGTTPRNVHYHQSRATLLVTNNWGGHSVSSWNDDLM